MIKHKSLKVNLGAGPDYIEGWVNVDVDTENRVDVIADLTKSFPFKENSVDEIKASDILEHFTKEDGEVFLRECHRVLKPNGIMMIRTHNIFQIFSQFEKDPQVFIHFLYGDTRQTDIFGAHKYGYTRESFNMVAKKIGFEIISFENEETNFKILVKKIKKIDKKLKIGIIMQSPDMGGAETYMLSLISEFLKNKNKIFLASNKEKFLEEASRYPIKIFEVPLVMDIIGNYRGLIKTLLLLPFAFFYYSRLLYKFKKEKVDVILMSNFTEKLFVTLFNLLFKIPIIWIEYSDLKPVLNKNFFIPKFMYRFLNSYSKYIIVPSKFTMGNLIINSKVSLMKIKIVSLGISEAKMYTKNLIPEWRENFVIGNVSRLTREKGQEYLINVMPEVLKRNPKARLLIVGDGPDKNYYESLVDSLNLTGKVRITGFVKDLNNYYSQMDLFIFPTVWDLEGFGLVLAEAMSHKLPIIANNIGPVPEIIQDNKNGILVDVKNKKMLSNAILKLFRDKKLRKELGENGYNRFKEKYTLKKSSSEILEVLYEATIA